MKRPVFVVGGHVTPFIGKRHPDFIWKRHPEFGSRENPTLEEYLTTAVQEALSATGVPAEAVQKAWVGNFVGELFCQQGHLGAALVGAHPGLLYTPSMRVEGACASGGLAFSCAVDAIQGGSDVALVAGVEVQTTFSARDGGDFLARAAHYRRQRSIDDFTFPALFARRTQAYQEAFGVSSEDIGRVAVKAYNNANKNPLAHMHHVSMDLETAGSESEKNPCFLSHEAYRPYIKMSDCSQVSDGAAAMILMSEEGLEAMGKGPSEAIELVGMGVATGNLYTDETLTELATTRVASNRAYHAAGLTPLDMNIAEVHDCFTVTELMMYEAIGLAEKGEGAKFLRDGHSELGGSTPVNTGGGLIGFGHPVGATGVKQVLEIYRQMKGLCGEYQIPNTPGYGITTNMGGDDKTTVTSIFKNCG